jgi:hypothetical protein
VDQGWEFLGVLAGAPQADAPSDIYERLIDAAFRGEVDWDQVRQSPYLKPAFRRLFSDMATRLETREQLRALLVVMSDGSNQPVIANGLREASGRAGSILLARAGRERGTQPLPAQWRETLRDFLKEGRTGSGIFWATHLLRVPEAAGPAL